MLPPGFATQEVGPSGSWESIVALAIAPDGRIFVAERRGRVHVIQNNFRLPVPFLDIEKEVLFNGDRGLLGIALDPGFASNGHIYLLYTVDPNADGIDDDEAAFGRLARWTASAAEPNVADPGSKRTLIGESWESGIPSPYSSHTVACLRFGADGSLLVGAGDGAHADFTDTGGKDPGGFGPGRSPSFEDIGALRAQLLDSLAGKILRLDPATGAGLPSNPFFDGDPKKNASRVWAFGLRNPFRIGVKPGTGAADPSHGNPGTLYLTDVGWRDWEEVDICAAGGRNFGWPCFEGPVASAEYTASAPGARACAGITPTPPLAYWHHEDATVSSPRGLIGKAVTAIAFSESSGYPPPYRGVCFVAEFERDWIKAIRTDAADSLVEVLDFAASADGPVDMVADPATGEIVYIAHSRSQVRKIRYDVSNRPPLALASADLLGGDAPLVVRFTAGGSLDPDGDLLSFFWSLGDGTYSLEAEPVHTYRYAGSFTATVTVDDGRGGQASATLRIEVTGSRQAPSVKILSPIDNSLFLPRAELRLEGAATSDDGVPETLAFSWEIVLHHNTHVHTDWLTLEGATAAFLPGDHDDGTGVWLEIILRAADAVGVFGEDRVFVFPGRPLVLDDGSPGTSSVGYWPTSRASRAYGGASVYSKNVGNTYTYSLQVPFPGEYSVHAWWTTVASRTTRAPYTVRHAGGETTVTVNQLENENRWNLLGTFRFETEASLVITAVGGVESTCADAVCLLPTGARGGLFLRGDVDGDGAFRITDPMRILLHLFQGGEAPSCARTADVDDAGTINLSDPIYLLTYMFRAGPPPPEPNAACGLDMTEDPLTCASYPACR